MRASPVFAAALLGGLVGCIDVPKEAGFPEVQKLAADRVPGRLHWKQGTEEDARVADNVHALLSKPLTADAAVQIALLNNPELQAHYEELGIAQADLVQAGLLKNPVFIGEARFGRTTSLRDVDLDFLQDFLDVLTRAARQRIAGFEFEQAKRRVAGEVVELAMTVRKNYFAFQGAQNVAAVQSTSVQAADASLELARELNRIGNVTDLDLARNQDLYERARIELAQLDGEAYEAREMLNRLMGVYGLDASWSVADTLPPVPDDEIPLDHLETLAISRRLDLDASKAEVQNLAENYAMTRDYRYIGMLQVGPSAAERPEVSRWVAGFITQVELPIFDQGQARVARADAEVRRSQWQLAKLAIDIRSEVRAARYRMLVAREVARHYRRTLLPLEEKIVGLAQRYYNFMLVGAFELLETKRREIETDREYVKATRDYWVARAELERLVGGRLPEPLAESPLTPPEPKHEEHQHEHH